MKHENLSRALDEISQTHIAEASRPKKKTRLVWFGAVAAVLAVVILAGVFFRPMTAQAQGLIAAPIYPENPIWQEQGYADSAREFFRESLVTLMSGSGEENAVCSPVNLYMALAMLAESTGGESRQEILDALGSQNLESLRVQANQVWNSQYRVNDTAQVVLANSLWLDTAYGYTQETVDTLADNYYASVYRGDLGSKDMNKALQDWLNDQTHGLLKEQAQEVTQDPDCLLALASTIYYNVQWQEEFDKKRNEEGIFHTPTADVDATYLRKDHIRHYYRQDSWSAVYEPLRDGSRMWLILPEEGVTPEQLLTEGSVLDLVMDSGSWPSSDAIVHLWLPKFDIAADRDILEDLDTLGIRQVQDDQNADFTPLIPDEEQWPYLAQASHATRVAVDEKGVTAAAYTVLMADGAASNPGEPEEVDFILDRPFLFVVESDDGLPLFAGIVNTP